MPPIYHNKYSKPFKAKCLLAYELNEFHLLKNP